jgi:hypothetical protein
MKFRMSTMAAAVGLAAGALTAPAHAANFVTSWDYEVRTYFSGNNTFQATGTGTQIQNETQVSWGSSTGGPPLTGANSVFVVSDRSGLTLSTNGGNLTQDQGVAAPLQTGNIPTNNGPAGITWITHHNNVIDGSFKTLLTSEIISTLKLTPSTWTGSPDPSSGFGPQNLTVPIYFAETSNTNDFGNGCVPGTGNEPCGDIFAIPSSVAFNTQFFVDGQDYFISTFPLVNGQPQPFQELSPEACARAGVPGAGTPANPTGTAPCVGFVTTEGQDNTFQFAFVVTGEPYGNGVPAPGTLLLMGAGLAGLGFLRRRKA